MADVKTLHETAARALGAKAGKVLPALDEVTVAVRCRRLFGCDAHLARSR